MDRRKALKTTLLGTAAGLLASAQSQAKSAATTIKSYSPRPLTSQLPNKSRIRRSVLDIWL